MGCNCGKKRKATGWGAGTARLSRPAKQTEEDNGPATLTRPDGTTEHYATRMEAHLAKIEAGGGTIRGDESSS